MSITAAPAANVLILLALPEQIRERYRTHLQNAFPELTINLVDHHGKVDPFIGEAEILITFGAHMADHVLADGDRLQWIQALGTGVDGITDRPALRKGVIVTNLHGHHGPAVSEAVISSMLALARDLRRSLSNQRELRWQRFPVELLAGKTVGIFGIGAIAEQLAPRCAALGMRVVGISSSARSLPDFERVWPREQLAEAVAEVDHLVLLTPYSGATHGIVDATVLAAMRPSAYLINVARGGIVDEPALLDALRGHAIAGAALDVFAEEPLPEGHPFWSMDNVLITPHTAGFHVGYADEVLPIVEANLRRYLAGERDHLVDLAP